MTRKDGYRAPTETEQAETVADPKAAPYIGKPGPKPRADRSTVISILKPIKWSPALLDRIATVRREKESFGACVRRLVEQAIESTGRTP